jgi:hypothetical protein
MQHVTFRLLARCFKKLHHRVLFNGAARGIHFSLPLNPSQVYIATGRIKSMKKRSDNIGNRTRDIPDSSAVSQ